MPKKYILIDALHIHGLHGLDFSLSSKKFFRKTSQLVYFALFLLGLTGFIMHTSLLVESYKKYSTVFDSEIISEHKEGIQFPAVTVCGLNAFKMSKIHHNIDLNNIQAVYNYAVQKHNLNQLGENISRAERHAEHGRNKRELTSNICPADFYKDGSKLWFDAEHYICYIRSAATDFTTYDQMSAYCASLGVGAHMVTYHNVSEEYIPWRHPAVGQRSLLGLRDEFNDGNYKWDDGSPIDYLNNFGIFNTSDPIDDCRKHDWGGGDRRWRRSPCTIGGTNAVCQLRLKKCYAPTSFGPGPATVNASMTVEGAAINVTCEPGYELSGSSVMRCDETGSWMEQPTCEPIVLDCIFNSSTIPYGFANTSDGTVPVGSAVEFQCISDALFTLQGDAVMTCLDDSTWSHTVPECIEVVLSVDEALPKYFEINHMTSDQRDVFDLAREMYEIENHINVVSIATQAKVASARVTQATPLQQLEEIASSEEDLLGSCRFGKGMCDFSSTKPLKNNNYGICHTFNSDGVERSERPGIENGLSAKIRTEQSELLFTSDAIGAKITLHDHSVYPFPDMEGVSVAKGFSYIIAYQKEQIVRRAELCRDTTAQFESIYPANYSYSHENCLRTCIATRVLRDCGCFDLRYPPAPTLANATRDCLKNDTCYIDSVEVAEKNCKCELPCRETIFDIVVTASQWPLQSTKANVTGFCTDETIDGVDKVCLETLRDTFVLVKIFPIVAHHETHSERLVIAGSALYSQICNAMSIWISASWLAIMEFIILLFDVTCGHKIMKKIFDL